MLTRHQKELRDIFVFVCRARPDVAEKMVRRYDIADVQEQIDVFKQPYFYGFTHKRHERIPYIAP